MKFKLEDIKTFVFEALKKYVWETFLRGASKGIAIVLYQIPIISIVAFVKDFLSVLGFGKSTEDRIYDWINNFAMKAIMGQQVIKFAWAI